MSDRSTTRRRWLRSCVGVTGAIAVAGCAGGDDESETGESGSSNGSESSELGSDWPMYGVDLQNTGYHPTARGPTGDELTKRKIFDMNGISPDPVCVVDGILYGHSTAGKMYALDTETEEILWETDRTGRPIVFDGMVYGPTTDVRVHGYDAETGDRWESAEVEPADGLSRPLPTNEGIFVTTTEAVWRIDHETGEYTRITETPYGRGSSDWTAFYENRFYIARSSELYAVNVETSDIEWIFEPNNEGRVAESNPTVAGGTVYIASFDKKLHAINNNSGEEVWSVDTETRLETSPAVANGLVYFGERGRIVAVDVETGDIEWEQDTEIGTPEDLVIADAECYAVSRFGIRVYDAITGNVSWKYDIPGESDAGFIAQPTIYEGTIYVQSTDKSLYAIEDS